MMPFPMGEMDVHTEVLVAVGGGLLLTPLPRLHLNDSPLIGAAVNLSRLIPSTPSHASLDPATGFVLAAPIATMSWMIEAFKYNAEGQGLGPAMRHHRDQARSEYRTHKHGGN